MIASKLSDSLRPFCLNIYGSTVDQHIDLVCVPVPFFDLWGNLSKSDPLRERLDRLAALSKISIVTATAQMIGFELKTRRGMLYTVHCHIVPVSVVSLVSAEPAAAGGVP